MKISSEWFRSYKLDLILGVIIGISPFFLYSHLLFDDSINTFSFFGLKISHYLDNNQNFVWQIMSSIIPIFLLSILYLTASGRWRYCLLLLIIMYFNRMIFNLQIVDDFSDGFTTPLGILLNKNLLNILIIVDIFSFSKYRKRSIILTFNNLFKSLINSRYITTNKNLIDFLEPKVETSNFKYLTKIYYIRNILDKQLILFRKDRNRRFLFGGIRFDLVVGIILVINISLWFLPYIIPENSQTLRIFKDFTIETNGFPDVHTFIWFTVNKFIIIIPLIIWFISSYYWWKYVILIPILLYSYQFWEAFQDVDNLDAIGNINAVPYLILLMLVLIVISKFMREKIRILAYYEYLDLEIEKQVNELAWKGNFSNVNSQIDKNSINGSNKNKLIQFRLELLKQKLIDQLEVKL